MKTEKSVSRKLSGMMIGFGVVIGGIFPFFTKFALGLPGSQVLSLRFFSMCIAAGIAVGFTNYFIFKTIVYDFLNHMNDKILQFKDKLKDFKQKGALDCASENCLVQVKSGDILVGNIANSFNEFIETIQNFFRSEMITDDFLEQLKGGLKIQDVAEIIVKSFIQYFKADAGCIISHDRGTLSVIKNIGVKIDMNHIDQQDLFNIISEGKIRVHSDLSQSNLKLNIVVGEITPNHIAFIPLKYQERSVGICILLSRNEFQNDFYSIESKNFISQATPFLYNSTLIRRLELLAAIDELTGILNRRFGMKRLHEEFERSTRHSLALSICMLDIDDFKRVNDTFGHQCGDFVLKRVAQLIDMNIRSSDFVLRYGGEEFLVVLSGASINDTFKIMERLRRMAETLDIRFGSYQIKFTFSGGICSFPAHGVDGVEKLIAKADNALYQAKREGKNRLVLAQ